MKTFCKSLREHVNNIIDFGKKKILPLTKEELKSHEDVKVCYFCGKGILRQLPKSLDYRKVRDYIHYTDKCRADAHSIFNLIFNAPNEISVVFQNGLNYDYDFIIKELTNKFEGILECLGKNTEKDNLFSFKIEK